MILMIIITLILVCLTTSSHESQVYGYGNNPKNHHWNSNINQSSPPRTYIGIQNWTIIHVKINTKIKRRHLTHHNLAQMHNFIGSKGGILVILASLSDIACHPLYLKTLAMSKWHVISLKRGMDALTKWSLFGCY
jgi:hypothetical protein